MAAPPLEAGRDAASDAPPVDYVGRVAALAPLITGSIDEIERDRRLPAPLLDAMLEAGLFRLLVPRSPGSTPAPLGACARPQSAAWWAHISRPSRPGRCSVATRAPCSPGAPDPAGA